jgi:iron complex transport system substrate-binding protein
MHMSLRAGALATLAASAIVLAGCATTPEATDDTPTTVTIVDNHGTIEVPYRPERVAALDNTTFQTLSDWGIKPVAVPKRIMYGLWPDLQGGDEVVDVGAHFEPDLEAVIESEPDLIIGGHRFYSIYEDLKEIQPATIELHPREGEDPIEELKRQITVLGTIFGREDDAQALADDLDAAIAQARDAYDGESTVVGLLTSGGEISYVAPETGRSIGPLFPALGLVPGIDRAADDVTHGDDISVEAIAAAAPEWLIVLDRDALLEAEGHVSAAELIEKSEALQNVPAVQKGQIVYLDASFYLDESIQAYTKLFRDLADAFAAADA